MEITKAVQRLGWRFKKASERSDHSFRLNQNDLKALRSIDDYIVKTQKEQFQDYELFAKLYINYLTELIEHYETTILDSVPRRKINNILKQSLPDLINKLTDSLNDSEKYSLFKEIKVDLMHPVLQKKEEAANNFSRLQEAYQKPENRKRLLGEVWKFEMVKDDIEREINRAINYNQKQT